MTTTATVPAAEILRTVIRQGENFAEYCLALEESDQGGAIIAERAQRALELGFYTVSLEGEFTLTASGEALIAQAAA